MITRAAVVSEARSWVGTPWMHQQRLKGAGVDCIGLIRGVFLGAGLQPTPENAAKARQYDGYARVPDGVRMKAACDEFMVPIAIADMQPGDVILMRIVTHPQHAAILAEHRQYGGLSMIHALNWHGVKEHRLDATWRTRIVAAYSLPGVQ